jgi:histidine triad (HIT) family protein
MRRCGATRRRSGPRPRKRGTAPLSARAALRTEWPLHLGNGRERKPVALTDWYCEEVLPGKLEVERIFEDERVLAFRHPWPSAQPHVVIIPKEHVPSLLDEKALDPDMLLSMIRAVQQAATALGLDSDSGFYVRANAAAPGVTPHMHWHVLPGADTNWPRLADAPQER